MLWSNEILEMLFLLPAVVVEFGQAFQNFNTGGFADGVADVVIFGHTHQFRLEQTDGISFHPLPKAEENTFHLSRRTSA